MKRSVLFLAAVGLLLAGCSSPSKDPVGQDAAPTVVTDPRDLANGTAPGSHVHDYWQGRTEVDVLSGDASGTTSYSSQDRGPIASFDPADGSIVPQGTGQLEATLSWQQAADQPVDPLGFTNSHYTRMELWVRTALDAEAMPIAVAENGVPIRFNSTNEQDDPPHYVLSLWEFQAVAVNEGGDRVSFSGDVHMEVKAFRTLPLVVFPPHPDPWNGAIELTLVDTQGSAQETHLGFNVLCQNGCLPYERPAAGTTVPFDASSVTVLFTPSATATPVPLSLQVHGADTRAMTTVEGQRQANGALVFTIPVEPGMGDSPYATQSLWEFHVVMSTPQEQGTWQGDYTFVVKALR